MAKRRCKGKTKKGTRCKAAPLLNAAYCLAHSDEEVRDKTGFGGPQENAGRPRVPRISEVLTAKIEERAEQIVDVVFEALEAEAGIVVRLGKGVDQLMSAPDHRTRLAAARELLDRGIGKPKQPIEASGEDGGPIRVTGAFDDPDTREALLAIARRVGDARADQPRRAGAGD